MVWRVQKCLPRVRKARSFEQGPPKLCSAPAERVALQDSEDVVIARMDGEAQMGETTQLHLTVPMIDLRCCCSFCQDVQSREISSCQTLL